MWQYSSHNIEVFNSLALSTQDLSPSGWCGQTKLFRRRKWREVRSSIWWLFLSKCGPFQVYGTLDGSDDPSCKYMIPALWWVVSTSLVWLVWPHCFNDPNHWSDGLHEKTEIVNSTRLGWLNNTDLQWLGPNSDNLYGITIHSRIWWGQQAIVIFI